MTIKEAKQQFIQAWGALGSQWGINKTMAQIHALLLLANEHFSNINPLLVLIQMNAMAQRLQTLNP